MADQLKGKLCCICIAVEVRSFEFVDSEPKQFLEKIFMDNGFDQLVSYGNLYICYECHALLDKTYKFIKKAFKAQQILLDMYEKSNMITLEQLKAVNRKELDLNTTNLSISKFNVEYFADGNDSLCMVAKNKYTYKPFANPTLNDKYNTNNIESDSFVVPIDNGTNLSIQGTSFLKNEYHTAKAENQVVEYIANATYEKNDNYNLKIESLDIADSLDTSILNEEIKSAVRSDINVSNDDIDFCVTEDKQDIVEVYNDKSLIEPDSINNADPLADLDDVMDHVSEEEGNTEIRKKIVWPVKDTDPDYKLESSSQKSKKPKKQVKTENKGEQPKQKIIDRTYKPSVFMQNLSSIADKKRTRKEKKYVYSDDSDDCNIKNMVYGEIDFEYNPECSDDAHSESEDSAHDQYDDEGRRLKIPDREYPMKCEHCEAEIPMKKVHYVHYLVAHPHIEYPYPLSRKRTILCQICGHVCKTMALYRQHELTHGTERAFACHICPKRFKNRYILIKHINGRHKSIDLECDYCGKTFKTRSEITVHIRIHTGEKPFKCHICGVGYAHRGNVGVHIRSAHQGLKDKPKKKTKQKGKEKRRRTKRVKDSTIDKNDEPLVKDSTIDKEGEPLVKDSTVEEDDEPLIKVKKRKQKVIRRRKRKHDSNSNE